MTNDIKWTLEAKKQGWTWLAQSNRNNSFYSHDACGNQKMFGMGNMRNGLVKCDFCWIEKIKSESQKLNWLWIKTVNAKSSKYIHTCGSEQIFEMGAMRKGTVKCLNCKISKWEKEAEFCGWTLVKQLNCHNALYQHSCGYIQNNQITHVRRKNVTCHGCNESWTKKPSNIYLLKIEIKNEETFLKLGIAIDVEARAAKYGLPRSAKIKIIRTIAYKTGSQAQKSEKRIHKTLTNKQGINRFDGSKYMKNGQTECYEYSLEAENEIINEMTKEKNNG